LSSSLVVVMCMMSHVSTQGNGGPSTSSTFELYSWRAERGEWLFSMFHATTSRRRIVDEVVAKDRILKGTSRLKRKIAGLPPGSTIVWADSHAVEGDGRERFTYPEQTVIREIRRFADDRNIKIIG